MEPTRPTTTLLLLAVTLALFASFGFWVQRTVTQTFAVRRAQEAMSMRQFTGQ